MRPKKKPATAGHRVGTKRSDLRWQSPNGELWDSRLEAEIYESAKADKIPVRRCLKGLPGKPDSDTLEYWSAGTGRLSCRACGSADVGQLRRYTADLVLGTRVLPTGSGDEVHTPDSAGRCYIDIKGFVRSNKRSLLRAFHKARPEIDLRLILERDYKISKTSSFAQWCNRTLRVPYVLWNGHFPSSTDWIMPHESKIRKAAKKSPKGLA